MSEHKIPQATEIEQTVIGHALQDPVDVLDAIADALGGDPKAFYHPQTRSIYETLVEMHGRNMAIDMVTVSQFLQDRGMSIDQSAALSASFIEWIGRAITLSNVPHYLKTLAEKKMLRDALEAAQGIFDMINDPDIPARDVLESAQAKLYAVQVNDNRGPQHIGKFLPDVIAGIEAESKSDGRVVEGLTTGFESIDKMMCGLKAGELTFLAARPSMGKSLLGMNIAEHVGVDLNLGVDVYSLEMSSHQLTRRTACARGEINLDDLRNGAFTQAHSKRLFRACKEIKESKIYIDDTAGISIAELRARARRSKLKRDINLVVIDHLGLMRGVTKKAQTSANGEISEISAALKVMAKELQVHVLCLVQLNREVEKRKGNRPQLSDLRDSGSIEQDADNVLMLTRPAYYLEGEAKAENAGIAHLIVAKQRDGATGDIQLIFQGEMCKFRDAVQNNSSK